MALLASWKVIRHLIHKRTPTDPLIHMLQIADPAITLLVHKREMLDRFFVVNISMMRFIVELAAEFGMRPRCR